MTPFRVSTDFEAKGGLFMEFEWDKNKAAANLLKHDVSFDEAKTVFSDPLYVDFYDIDHSDDEHRYIIVGQSPQDRLLIVSYTEREYAIRLISAREAIRQEREIYEKY
jgi:uncharacterized DUF497 family protein